MHNDPRHTAIHEAGHAVIGRVLNLVCGSATIVPDDDSTGHHIIADPYVILQAWENTGRWRDYSTALRGRILALMAGREAEEEVLGLSQGGDTDDQVQIAMMMDDLAGSDWERQNARLRSKTRELVRRHRGRIERVAAELLAQRTIAGPEIDALVRAPA